jgi:hypothetical protein
MKLWVEPDRILQHRRAHARCRVDYCLGDFVVRLRNCLIKL